MTTGSEKKCLKCGAKSYGQFLYDYGLFGICFKNLCLGRIIAQTYPKPEAKGFKKGDTVRFTRVPKDDPEYMELATLDSNPDGDFVAIKFKVWEEDDDTAYDKFMAKYLGKYGYGRLSLYNVEILALCDKLV